MSEKLRKMCPLCKGSGLICSQSPYTPEQLTTARKLYAEGNTLRAIGKIVGIDHPQKVRNLIMSNYVVVEGEIL